MAVSAETQAILDSLNVQKQEFTEGTSLKDVNVTLEKFSGVFQSISANLISQSTLMARQMGIAEEELEAKKRKQDFDEITQKSEEKDRSSDVSVSSSVETERKERSGIFKGLTDMMGLGSLAKAALGASGIFAAYNIGKGFLDEKFNGAFSDFENKAYEFATGIDLDSIKKSFADLKLRLDEMLLKIDNLVASFQTIGDKVNGWIEKIEQINWMDVVGAIAGLVSGIGLAKFGISQWLNERRFRRMNNSIQGAVDKAIERTNKVTPKNPIRAQTTIPKLTNPDIDGKSGAPKVGGAKDAKVVRLPPRSMGIPTTTGGNVPKVGSAYPNGAQPGASSKPKVYGSTNNPNTQMRQAAGNRFGKAGYTVTANGSLKGPDGKFVSNADALKMLQSSLDPVYGRFFANLVKVFKGVGIVLAAAAIYEIYVVMSTPGIDNTERARRLAPILGASLGAVGFGILGGIAGTLIGGPWGALIGAALTGVAGAFAGEWVAFKLAQWMLGDSVPSKQEIEAFEKQNIEEQTYQQMSQGSDFSVQRSKKRSRNPMYDVVDGSGNIVSSNAMSRTKAGIFAQNQQFKKNIGQLATNDPLRYLDMSTVPQLTGYTPLVPPEVLSGAAGGQVSQNVVVTGGSTTNNFANTVKGGATQVTENSTVVTTTSDSSSAHPMAH